MKNLVRHNIVIAGACNSGKSSLLNAITGRNQAVVSDKAGTTTDPVKILMEIPEAGMCRLIDTPGLDDDSASEIGKRRVEGARKALAEASLVILTAGFNEAVEAEVMKTAAKGGIPVIRVATIADKGISAVTAVDVTVSAKTSEGIPALITLIGRKLAAQTPPPPLFGSLVSAGDHVVLVMPQDSEAPKDRLILPQSLSIRTLLDLEAIPVCCTPDTYQQALGSLKELPALVVTDSQVFRRIADATPESVPLTSFSILMANHKGDLETFLSGAEKLLTLAGSSASIIIAQACNHVPDNEDIGTVKLPALLRKRLGDRIKISWCYGSTLPDNIATADLLIHCGGCMFTRSHIMNRLHILRDTGVPVTNYGLAIAACTGILKRIVLP